MSSTAVAPSAGTAAVMKAPKGSTKASDGGSRKFPVSMMKMILEAINSIIGNNRKGVSRMRIHKQIVSDYKDAVENPLYRSLEKRTFKKAVESGVLKQKGDSFTVVPVPIKKTSKPSRSALPNAKKNTKDDSVNDLVNDLGKPNPTQKKAVLSKAASAKTLS
eukprot:Polyplicarium_translucidae@DN3253_c0_g2_i1.p2